MARPVGLSIIGNMKYFFNGDIKDWKSWEKIYQSTEIWKPLINFIFKKENLPVSTIENLKPGTNAVFKSGKFIIKILVPEEAGHDGNTNNKSEIFALTFAQSSGVLVPKLIAEGEIHDKYIFSYMVMEFIEGVDFNEHTAKFNDDEKYIFAKRIRKITDSINKPCENFNGIDVIHDQSRYIRWDDYSENLRMERLEYLNSHDFGEKVFVHGDLCYGNFIIDNNNDIFIIDFEDSVIAPQSYEHAQLISVLFNFDKSYLRGYFGEYEIDNLVDLCFNGLLIHEYGGYIITHRNIAETKEITYLKDLREKLYKLFK